MSAMRTLNQKATISAAVIVIIAAALIFFVIASRGDDKKTDTTNQTTSSDNTKSDSRPSGNAENNQSTDNQQGAAGSSGEIATTDITIQSMAFTPEVIKVTKGSIVTWLNKDDVQHTVTVTSGDGPKSQPLENGDSYSYTFNEAGTFTYECTFHPSMTGKIIVE
jgi:plastocyanin